MEDSAHELSEHVQKRLKQLLGFFSEREDDPTYVILKSHLLSEEILRDYLSSIVKRPYRLDEARLSFSQLVSICRALHPGLRDDWWGWIGLNKLNSLRNQLAHRLDPQGIQEKIIELTQIVIDQIKDNKKIELLYEKLIESKMPPLLVSMVALHSELMGALEI